MGGIVVLGLFFIITLTRFWWADTLFASGSSADELGNPGKAYNLISYASELNPGEPFYKSELGFVAAEASVAIEAQDSSLSAQLKDRAILQTSNILQNYPNNVSYFRTAVRTYYMLSALDTSFINKTLETMDQAIKLAPTDPKLLYNKAIILSQEKRNQEAIIELKKAIKLKPNYVEAIAKLKELTK